MLAISLVNNKNPLWDIHAYLQATENHVNPYRTDIEIPFVYHPYILLTFRSIHAIASLKKVLLAFYTLSTCFLVWQSFYFIRDLFSLNKKKRYFTYASSIILSTANQACMGVFKTANITFFLHSILLAMTFKCLRSKKASHYYMLLALITLASLVKPYLLAYLLMTFYLVNFKKMLLGSTFSGITTFLIWISGMKTMPLEYQAMLTALKHQTFGQGDLGRSIFVYLYPKYGIPLALGIHCLTLGIGCYLLFFQYPKYPWKIKNLDFLLAIILIVCTNPRVKEYDYYIARIALHLFITLIISHSWKSSTLKLLNKKKV